ncbi:F20H23.27 PROTEIN-RELATED [Salix purpurea]|uniref:Choline transporter-like protein n=1 Tax=Salix purpurea TaxID=77065 RepID=A0A9Q0ZRG7_SALPP|nr:F20H23.27 PROTEIN-RELATED [Salix purpurea]
MERSGEMNAAAGGGDVQNLHIPSMNTTVKVQESRVHIEASTVAGRLFQRLFRVLFFVHIVLIAILVVFLAVRGLLSAHSHHFHPKKWYPPLLTATACAGIVAFTWQWFTFCNPSRALKAAFWLSPLLTCAVLSVTSASPPAKNTTLISLSIILSTLYSCFLVSGIGGATAVGTVMDTSFILVILASMSWSMHVMKNTLQVTVARIKYLHFASGADLDSRIALRDTIKYSMGSVIIGSVLVPIITVIRGSARAISLIGGGTDEFLFSCADCYSSVAAALVRYGNRWGLVQVGVYNMGFVQASMHTWEMLRRVELEPIIDRDLTGSFCFFCGMAGGAICTLVAGTWTFVVHRSYATEVSIYAFLIGYFMCRIAMAWQQSCVAAYYIAYSESPENPRLDPNNSISHSRISETWSLTII